MDVHEGTVKSLVRALARGDLSTLEECAVALASGGAVHAPYRDEDMWPRQRLLQAWRHALPPYHRNPARRDQVERRTRERRLVGCYVELVLAGDDLDRPSVRGTIMEDRGDAWRVEVKLGSLAQKGSGLQVKVPLEVPLDSIRACVVHVNPQQLALHPAPDGSSENHEAWYLGLPEWSWFADKQECGLAFGPDRDV